MTTDGSLIFDTKMDDTHFNKQINSVNKKFSQSGDKIKAILNDTEKTAKSKAASIAAEYRKMGQSQSEAMKNAWDQIEREGVSAGESIGSSNKNVSNSFSDTANDIMESSSWITMAVKAVTLVFEQIAKVAASVANTVWTATKKIAQGIAYATAKVGKFTLKQFIGDWESQNSGFKQMLLTATSAFSIYKFFDFGKESVELGSDLAEVQNVVDVTFTSMSEKVNQWAVDAKNAYGLSETMAKKYVGLFGSMSDAFGFTEEQSYEMATTLAGLSGDVASFYNLTQDEAYTKLKSVFSGETESLKDLGVVMTQSALDSYALANGYGKTTSAMTEAEKVSLRYNFVLDQLSNATGDFVRTQDSWANQVRILQLRWQSLQSTVGRGLINALTPAIKILNILVEKLQIASEWFENLMTAVFGDSSGSTGAISENLDIASDSASQLADSADSASDSINDIAKAAEKVKSNLADYDELNVMSADNSNSDDITDIIQSASVIDTTVKDVKNNVENTIGDINFSKLLQQAIKEGNWKAVGKLIGQHITSSLKNIKWADIKKQAKNIAKNIVDFINGAIEGIDWSSIGTTLAESLNTLITFINAFFSEIDWDNLGESIAKGLNSFLSDFDAQEYSSAIANRINAIFDFIDGFAFEFNWENLGNKIGESLLSYFQTLNLSDVENGHSIPETIAEAINGIITAGIELFTYTDSETGENIFAVIGTQLGKGFQEFIDKFEIENAVTFVKEGIGAIVKFIYNTFKQLDFTELGTDLAKGVNGWLDDDSWWTDIGIMISEIFNDILDFAIAFINKLDVNKLSEALQNLFGSIDFDGIVSKVCYLFQTALLKGVSALLKSLSSNPLFAGTWMGWKTFLKTSDIRMVYGDEYIDEVLGENKEISGGGAGGNFGKKTGKELADNVTTGFTTTINKNKNDFIEATTKVIKEDLEKNEDTITNDTSMEIALKTKGADGMTALKDAFDKSEINRHFSEVWSGIKSVFSNVKSWFSKIFSDAWDKVKCVFSNKDGIKNIKTSVENVFKNVLNDLIDGLNNAISFPFESLNFALDRLRNWDFAKQKPFHWLPEISVPQIPKLATGTVVPANYGEFLAILGDNKREAEVVSPLSTIEKAVENALAKTGFNNSRGEMHITLTMPDGSVLFKTVVQENDSYKKSHGHSALA